VTYRLKASEDDADTVERIHDIHREKCPVYRSLRAAIEITTSVVRADP